jgi:hypothetical protein
VVPREPDRLSAPQDFRQFSSATRLHCTQGLYNFSQFVWIGALTKGRDSRSDGHRELMRFALLLMRLAGELMRFILELVRFAGELMRFGDP